MTDKKPETYPIRGIRYYTPPATALLVARDGNVSIPYGGIPIPLLQEDFASLADAAPSYDAVGRGIYQALRANPDLPFAQRYAAILKEGYPHIIAELGTHIIMLDSKDVEVSYLDRKITALRILSLLEPDNPHLPFQVGAALFDRGMRLSGLTDSTVVIYRAERYLRDAQRLDPGNTELLNLLGDVLYCLGKYADAATCWRDLLPHLAGTERSQLESRLVRMEGGEHPMVPVVDYLEAAGVAFDAYERQEYDEVAAILRDILGDQVFLAEFPVAELSFVLGSCYSRLAMPRDAGYYLRHALELRPDYDEAAKALAELEKRTVLPL